MWMCTCTHILATVCRLSPKLAAAVYIVYTPAKNGHFTWGYHSSSMKGAVSSGRNPKLHQKFWERFTSLKDSNTDCCTAVVVSLWRVYPLTGEYWEDLLATARVTTDSVTRWTRTAWTKPDWVTVWAKPPEPSRPDVLSQTVYSELLQIHVIGSMLLFTTPSLYVVLCCKTI